jgi:predicted ATPase
MKISEIKLKNFKRFTDLTITNIPITAKVVIIVGPNGSGKSSLFDAFLSWHKFQSFVSADYGDYYSKFGTVGFSNMNDIKLAFYDYTTPTYPTPDSRQYLKSKFYFRSAYRNEAEFLVSGITSKGDPTNDIRINSLIQNDSVVKENYERLVSSTLKALYDSNNNSKSVQELREELIGKIRTSLTNVFGDLNLSSIGDPLNQGSFYFEKGMSKNFPYKNLSAGEKAAFDLILDIIIKSEYYPDAIMCIDEPETHMHTRLQAKLFEELYRLLPNNSQLWINTHSLGMLKKARDIENQFPDTISFVNFDNTDFDSVITIQPSKIDKAIWEKFIEITLDDFSNLLAPKTVVFCEGNPAGRGNKNFDASIYTRVFKDKYPDTSFISMGSASEIENDDNITFKVVKDVLKGSSIIKIVDRDDKSPTEITDLQAKSIRVLSVKNIECYLLDDEILKKLCEVTGNPSKVSEVLASKQEQINKSVARNNPLDDIKSAAGDIYVNVKRILQLTGCGNSKEAFMRDTICPLITPDTGVFQMIERDIFG